MKMHANRNAESIVALRVVTGLIFISHGAARLYYKSIPDFGVFLDNYS